MPSFTYNRSITWVSHLTFAVLAILAVWFFKERTIILDAAFQSFEVIKRGWFAIQVNRFGAAMTQVFPLVASKMKVSFPTVLILYSLSFVLVHWIMFVICDKWLKVKALGFAIILFNVMMVNNTFYWVQNEIIQAVSLNFVFWALMIHLGHWKAIRWYHYVIALCLIITIAFFHPLTVFSFAFVAAYFFLDSFEKKKVGIQRSLTIGAVAAFGASLTLKYFAFPNNYDTMTTGRFSEKNINAFFADPFNTGAFDRLIENFPIDFYLLAISLIVVSVFFIRKKLWLKLLFTWCGIVGYMMIVMISYIEGGFWFHVESQYLPVSILLILPLVWEVLPNFSLTGKGLRWTMAILSVSIFIRIIDIVDTSKFYTQRVDYISNTLKKTWSMKGTKFIMSEDLISKDTLMQHWSFGYETLYYSALQSPDSTRSICVYPDIEKHLWRLNYQKMYLARWNSVPYDDLPHHLFNFTDTTGNYQLIKKEDFEK